MGERQPWPYRADEQRMDAIALALDVQVLTVRLEQANLAGDRVEVARLNKQLHEVGKKIQRLMIEAHRT